MNSVMTSLIWKEFRVQRQLWLILAVFPFGLGLLVTAMGGRQDVGEVSFFTSLGVALAFAAAASVMTFSLEEEEGTAIWTRLLPMSTRTLLLSKLFFVATATVGLIVAALGLSGLLCAVLDVTLGPRLPFGSASHSSHDTYHLTFASINLLLIAMWSSLQCRKVFRALFMCGLTFAIYRALMLMWDGSLVLPVITFIVLSLLLTRSASRWHRGSNRASLMLTAGSTARTILPLRIADLIMTGMSEAGLRWAATRSPAGSRNVATLTWMECRKLVPFLAQSLVGGGVLILSRYVENGNAHIPLLVGLAILAIESGLRMFRHDQQEQHGLFWSHRGVSPALILFSRTCLWLASAFCIAAVLVLVEQFVFRATGADANSLTARPTTLSILEDIGAQHAVSSVVPSFWNNALVLALAAASIWFAGLFSVSALCSCWIRRPIVAAFVALISAIGFSFWFGFRQYFGYPLWLTAIPLIGWLWLAVVVTRRQWMDRRTSGRFILRQACLVVLPCAALIPVQRLWRTMEIPVTVSPVPTPSLRQMGYHETHDFGNHADAWQRFVDVAFSQYPTIGGIAMTDFGSPTSEVRIESLKAINDIDSHGAVALPPRFRHPWTRYGLASAVNWVCSAEIIRLRESNETAAACAQALQEFRLQQRLLVHASTTTGRMAAEIHIQSSMQQIRDMIAEASLTPEQLRALLAEFKKSERLSLDVDVARNRKVAWQQVLNRNGYLWERYQNLRHRDRSAELTYWPVDLIEANYAERYRMMQLLEAAESFDGSSDIQQRLLQHWVQTAPVHDSDIALAWNSSRDAIDSRVTHNAVAATGTIVALQLYRAEHDEFPPNLQALAKEFDWRSFTDADGRDLTYLPRGYGQPLPLVTEGETTVIHSDQPLLFTNGPSRHLSPSLKTLADKTAGADLSETYFDKNQFVFIDSNILRY